MSSLSVHPEMVSSHAVNGWRVWRVMPFARLDGTSSFRLCAVGTFGSPKVWDPLTAKVAVCSAFDSEHEAPWPDHSCGVWAFKDELRARRMMLHWMRFQTGSTAAWAVGRVSLWGRVVEHRRGWRAQYAYPFSVEIHGGTQELARRVADTYAVDVAWAGVDKVKLVAEKKERDAADENDGLDQFAEKLLSISTKLAALEQNLYPPRLSNFDEWRHTNVYPDSLTEAQLLAAVAEGSQDGAATSRQVTAALTRALEAEGRKLAWNATQSVACRLGEMALAGEVDRYRRRNGSGTLWAVPGTSLGEPLKNWVKSEHQSAAFDSEVLAALRRAVEEGATEPLYARDIAERLGSNSLSLKVRVAHAMRRESLRGTVVCEQGRMNSWRLATSEHRGAA